MSYMAQEIQKILLYKVTHDPLWKKLEVFFSDITEPGEGEHKIYQHMKNQIATK